MFAMRQWIAATVSSTASRTGAAASRIGATVWLCIAVLLTQGARAAAEQPATWRERFERARVELVREHYNAAAHEFDALAAGADNPTDLRLAVEFASLARTAVARRARQPYLRTGDELAILYTTAVFYGLGTSGWLALQLQPKSFGAALLPFAIITPAAVGAVALADSYLPLKHGIPHAIAAGMYLGFGESLWLVAYQHARAQRDPDVASWRSERVSTALWIGSSAGAVVGGLIGAVRRPTPGRISFTASAGVWSGMLSAFALSALAPERQRRTESAYLAGGIGYNVGLLSGILFGPHVAPSVARVRMLDLGGLGGALIAGGTATLFSDRVGSRAVLGAAAIGGATGLVLAWFATAGMAADRSHDALPSALGSAGSRSRSVHPGIFPIQGGWIASLQGEL